MLADAGSATPITALELARQKQAANAFLTSVTYEPVKEVQALREEVAPKDPSEQQKEPPKDKEAEFGWKSSRPQKAVPKSLSTFKVAKKVGDSGDILDNDVNFALDTVRTGLMIGLLLGDKYDENSGLRNTRQNGAVTAEEKRDYSAKTSTQAAVVAYGAAFYIASTLANYKQEELSGIASPFVGLPEAIPLNGKTAALNCVVFHYASYLEGVKTGPEAIRLTAQFFKAVVEEVVRRSGDLKFAEAFTGQTYKLEKGDFAVKGFKSDIRGAMPRLEIVPVKMEQVKGNQEAKRTIRRLCQFTLAYDFERKMNPLVRFGAYPSPALLKGYPGTAKTMLMGVAISDFNEYSDDLGLPFRPNPLSNKIVSTFQGGSAENIDNWFDVQQNPGEIVLGIIDDAEMVFEAPTGHSVSSGVKEIVGTFLRRTEGATAIVRGNSPIIFGSNNPDMLAPAVLSRIVVKVEVPGAVTREDFADQYGDFFDKVNSWETDRKIFTLNWPKDYPRNSAQGLIPPEELLERKIDEAFEIKDKRISAIYDRLRSAGLTLNDVDLYAKMNAAIRKELPLFTSREVRNILINTMTHFFGFDFDDNWLKKRDAFVAKDYDTKSKMILDAAHQHNGTLNMNEVLFQKTVQYLNAMVDIIDGGRLRRIRETAARIREDIEARALASSNQPLEDSQAAS